MTTQLPLHYRITRLYEGFRHKGSPQQLDQMVADHVSEIVGHAFSVNETNALRTRPAANPETDVLDAIAGFFDAPTTYLVGTTVEQNDYDAQLDYFDNVRNSQATVFALRTRVPQLTPDIAERLSVLVRDTHERFELEDRRGPAEAGNAH
ncbi:hypothetical protein HQ346_16960 [Rhodococcus sp. BP-252]|uniref:hypothetical protein n=1 Tax=unclassified Rhodococcus (in: high G+C Gram-positive bacteria) TaxID=192944 RepID=UPI001C9B0496|nr:MULTISPECIES: hypothetical protein [unclassified Rhodococcus (in: high G+C Gram-positive bacteria)]MBY6413387.1 hypothetical protein [Rhodococcus sp. BP-320]MBY6418009.1 hypothetical protein [Rhodococcus sp. BP-321]MBY6422301.1 hypothetical protein [Rhodococcus sp. BP-324]MBY6428058.1 hypothetical protein [Rhodococcus sp. BP-323]MBY6433308.1 hypothetical protein [Rhodococcus sp. BP-322]